MEEAIEKHYLVNKSIFHLKEWLVENVNWKRSSCPECTASECIS